MLSGAQGGSQAVKNGQINPNSWVAERCRSQVVGKGLVLPRLLWDIGDPRRRRGLFVLTPGHPELFSLGSCGLLQPDQHVVRDHHRVLHREQLPRHVRRAQVRSAGGC